MMRQFRLMPFGGDHEFTRNDVRALMDQLIKRVLPVGACRAPNNRTARRGDGRAVAGDRLAVTLHLELLEISRQQRQPLIIGQHRARGITADLAVPNAHQRVHERQIVGALGRTEMAVHRLRTAQHRIKRMRANRQHNAEANWAPQRIAPADPILKPEHLLGRNTKGFRRLQIAGERHKLRANIPAVILHPSPCSARIGHRLNRGKRLGSHDNQRVFSLQTPQGVRDMRPIHVGDEMHARPIMIGRQSSHRHCRAKV